MFATVCILMNYRFERVMDIIELEIRKELFFLPVDKFPTTWPCVFIKQNVPYIGNFPISIDC